MSVIPRHPASPPATNPNDSRYFDARDLEAELKRAFQICHECRMCVNYCGSFPDLFARIDKQIDSGNAEGAEKINAEDIKSVSDQCWQCKLCYIKCPYTPDEGAKELLDFPRLMARERAARAQRDGIPLVDKILGEPQLIGAAGAGVMAPLSNFVLASSLVRKVQEKVTGISAEFPLPPMARQTFSSWLGEHRKSNKGPRLAEGQEAREVVLFPTCYVEYNTPEVARAAVAVLEHNGFRVFVPGTEPEDMESMTCCGMPNLDGGDLAGYKAKVERNTALLLPHVRAGRKVLVPGPTCGYTMKREWAEYMPAPEVKEVAAATMDLMEFLVTVAKEKKLDREFKSSIGKVAYHAACHLRAQKIGFPGARLLGLVPESEVRVIEECSAVDGTWGMKAPYYETGRKYAQRLVRGVEGAQPDVVVSDCTLAGLRITKENEAKVVHPIQALADAYGLSY
ncbi:MAG: heterodisulfide reductase-related iron-sulfur binding cluster [Polyangiaceae bacterium]